MEVRLWGWVWRFYRLDPLPVCSWLPDFRCNMASQLTDRLGSFLKSALADISVTIVTHRPHTHGSSPFTGECRGSFRAGLIETSVERAVCRTKESSGLREPIGILIHVKTQHLFFITPILKAKKQFHFIKKVC